MRVTREQLRICGELTDYSPDEIEAMIARHQSYRPGSAAYVRATESEVYAAVLAEMRADHKARSMDQFRRSVGVLR